MILFDYDNCLGETVLSSATGWPQDTTLASTMQYCSRDYEWSPKLLYLGYCTRT